MSDIDQQPTEDLSGREAAEKIHAIAKEMRICMLGTYPDGGTAAVFRPMGVQTVDPDGSLWLLSSTQSDKNAHIARDPNVVLTCQNDGDAQYLVISGRATIHTDPATIERHWTMLANNWFDGKDDPRVSVIQVRPFEGHYWESRDGRIVATAKMLIGALGIDTGDDGGVEGDLDVRTGGLAPAH